MSAQPSRSERTKRTAAQARTVVRQWSEVIAESLGARPATEQLPAPPVAFDESGWLEARLAACWLGHATTLLRVGGLTVLTDPHLDDRAGMKIGKRKIGRRRAIAAPMNAETMPSVDVLLLSHAHMDHWDIESLVGLSKAAWAGRASVVIPRGTRDLLPKGFGRVIELDWGNRAVVEVKGSGLEVGAIKPRHWGARYIVDRHRGYNAYTIDATHHRVVFGGDTAMTDAFDHLASAPRPVELAVMGIGSYEPWEDQHATPEQVAEMTRRMGARLLMPIHHATFHDSNVGLDEPMQRLVRAWDVERMVCSKVGEVWVGD
jgi:L-ascorbate metabolism protein UlaG (beta-lactamase superfamily)